MTKQILYVNSPPYLGGAEASLLTLMRHLDSCRYRAFLLTSRTGLLTHQALRYGIDSGVLEFANFRKRYPWRYPYCILKYLQIMQSNQAALVHTNCDLSLAYTMYASSLYGIPYVSHVRDSVRNWFGSGNLLALKRASAVIANSMATRDACIGAGLEPRKVRVIYNPVDVSQFLDNAKLQMERTDLGISLPEDAFVVGIIGQIHPLKGYSDLVAAAKPILASVPATHFLAIGEAFTSETQCFKLDLERSIRDQGLSERFHFLGFRSDVPALMRLVDVVVVPSLSESFGRVIIEAFASRRAVIATRVGGIPEVIDDEINGILVSPNAPSELASAVVRIAGDDNLRRRLEIAGGSTISRYGVEEHVSQIQSLYDELCNSSDLVRKTGRAGN